MLPVSRVIGHKEWAPGRKSDPLYDMNWRRGQVAAFTPQGGDMPLTEADKKIIYEAVWFGAAGASLIHNYRLGNGEWPYTTLGAMDGRLQNEVLPAALQPVRDMLAKVLEASKASAQPVTVNVDAAAVAAALKADAGFIAALAKATCDEADRRTRDGNPATGPVS